MPYPNFHAARLKDPDLFARIVVLQTLPNGIMIYGGPLKAAPEGEAETQAYRFPKDKFTMQEAKAWLEEHKVTVKLFEPAEGKAETELYILPGSSSDFEQSTPAGITPEGKLFRKELIRVGEWVHPQDQSKTFRVTLDRMKEWITNFKKNLVKVFVPERHSSQPSDNRGWLKDLVIEGEKLYGILDITNPLAADQITAGDIKDVSISVDPDYIDSHGTRCGEVLQHIALTLVPHIEGQAGFAALEGREYDLIFFEKGKNKDEEEKTMDELLKAKMEIEALKKEKAEVEKVKAEHDSKVKSLETKTAELEKAVKEKDARITEFETAKRKARETAIDLKLEKLITEGRLTPAVKDKVRAALLNETTVKLEKGDAAISDIILEAFGEMPMTIDFSEKAKDDNTKPGDKAMTDEKARIEAERISKGEATKS